MFIDICYKRLVLNNDFIRLLLFTCEFHINYSTFTSLMPSTMKHLILIIDDDRDTLEILGCLIAELSIGVVLKSTLIPLSEIKEIRPDLIILDERVAGSKGSELCSQIKRCPDTKDIPVVMISAAPDIGKIAMDSDAEGCIWKPFDIEEIEDVIAAYLPNRE